FLTRRKRSKTRSSSTCSVPSAANGWTLPPTKNRKTIDGDPGARTQCFRLVLGRDQPSPARFDDRRVLHRDELEQGGVADQQRHPDAEVPDGVSAQGAAHR